MPSQEDKMDVESTDGAAHSDIDTAGFFKKKKEEKEKPKSVDDSELMEAQIFDKEDEELFSSPPEKLHLSCRNQCIVISNKFLNKKGYELPGYEHDENNIKRTFGSLNFDVEIEKDKTVGEIKRKIECISREDFKRMDCLVLFILSHGERDEATGTEMIIGKNLKKIDIHKEILVELKFIKVPKLIFVQACRGKEFPTLEETTEADSYVKAAGVKPKLKVAGADIAVFYSTMAGDVSFVEHVSRGSFFVDHLCKVLRAYYKPEMERKYHFMDVVTKVNQLLASYIKKFEDKIKEKGKEKVEIKDVGQVSQIVSTLTKNVFFQSVGNYGE